MLFFRALVRPLRPRVTSAPGRGRCASTSSAISSPITRADGPERPHYRGLILSNLGDHRAALHLLHEAERQSGAPRARFLSRVQRRRAHAGASDRVGRYEEALALRRKDLADLPSDAADERTMLENGTGFGLLMLAETEGGSGAMHELAEAEDALTRADREEPGRAPYLSGVIAAHRAEVALLEGKLDEASTELARASGRSSRAPGERRLRLAGPRRAHRARKRRPGARARDLHGARRARSRGGAARSVVDGPLRARASGGEARRERARARGVRGGRGLPR